MRCNECYIGDCRDGLNAFLSAGMKVQTCITSPPYWGLRDYGVDGQLGLEPDYRMYIDHMVEVMALVREVLADDGTLWLNLGDSYYGGKGQSGNSKARSTAEARGYVQSGGTVQMKTRALDIPQVGLKPKDLMGMPWRVAFALQADGWYLRQDIIWSKPNPMPESVRDRCTKAHEYIFLLSKSKQYYYDHKAIREPAISGIDYKTPDGWDTSKGDGGHGSFHKDGREKGHKKDKQRGHVRSHAGFDDRWDQMSKEEQAASGRNKRSVWTVATRPYPDAHFATFPRRLIEPCVLAGSRTGDIVLDPFMGSGTTAQVAEQLGRQWIGCELNPDYLELQRQRLMQQSLSLGHE